MPGPGADARDPGLEAIFDLVGIGIAEADPETGRIVRANQRYQRITGYTGTELREITIQELAPPTDRARDWRTFQLAREKGAPYRTEKRYLRKDGSTVDVRLHVAFLHDDDGVPTSAVAICEDISDEVEARRDRARLMQAVEQAGEGFILADADGNIEYVNPAFEAITGYSREEVQGRNPRVLQSGEHGPEHYAELWARLRRGQTWRGRFTNRRKDGSRYLADAVISPVLDDNGQIARYVGVQRDVTEQVEIQERLVQSQKLESVGHLAGGVAHDFNNMLSVILGSVELVLEQTGPENPLRESLLEIRTAAHRSTAITGQLLTFARRRTISPRVVDLNEVVRSMLKMLNRLIGEHLELAWHPVDGVLPVHIDPVQVNQIIANLCVNARDAIRRDTGRITLESGRKHFDEAYCLANPGFLEGHYVLLAISDDGHGMDAETRDRAFEPFFTTKPEGAGTGLGLSTVHGIVHQNGGFIKLYSEVEEGTTFRIYLPARQPDDIERLPDDVEDHVPGGFETVLIVEDEPGILRTATRILERQGYTVLPASTPAAAIELESTYRGEIHLLVTDVVMPGMNGEALASALQIRRPGLPCLFMSGYTATVIGQRGVLDPDTRLVQKPFSVAEFAVAVRGALDQG